MTENECYILSRSGIRSLRKAGIVRGATFNGAIVAAVKMGFSHAKFLYKSGPEFYQPMAGDKRKRPENVLRRRAMIRFCRGIRSALHNPRLRRVYGTDFKPSIEVVGVDGFLLNDAIINQKWYNNAS